MSWASLADLAHRAVRDHFGVAVTYTPTSTGLPESIRAIFDAAFQRVEQQGETWVSATRPLLTVRLADLSVAPVQGDTFAIGATIYTVTEVQGDGHGGAKLFAREST